MTDTTPLAPCPFCGGPVQLEEASPTRDRLYGERRWYGVVCRNTTNIGGSCAMEQRPSASKETAIARWNRRASQKQVSASAAEFALQALVAAGHVSQELVDKAMVLPGAPQPAHSGAPVAYYQPDDPSSSSAFSWPGSERNTAHNKPLFTAPQPVEQEPLSPEQRSAAFARAEKKMQSNINLSWRDAIVDEIEAAHGITPKGGQHGAE